MNENAYVFSIIARRIPAIWDVINQGSYVAINPQPLPPMAREVISELNPQPLPPGPPPEAIGARVGVELARLAWASDKLGQQLSPVADWEENPCGSVPIRLKIPSWLHPVPDPDPEPWWYEGYFLGLACSLAVAQGSTHGEFVKGAFETTVGSLTHVQRQLAESA